MLSHLLTQWWPNLGPIGIRVRYLKGQVRFPPRIPSGVTMNRAILVAPHTNIQTNNLLVEACMHHKTQCAQVRPIFRAIVGARRVFAIVLQYFKAEYDNKCYPLNTILRLSISCTVPFVLENGFVIGGFWVISNSHCPFNTVYYPNQLCV